MIIVRFLLALLPGLLLASCQQAIKLKKGRPYHVSGQVANCEGCEVTLQLYDYGQVKAEQTAIQVDTVRKGRFQIAGRTTRPGFYEVLIKKQRFHNRVRAIIYLPADSVHLQADPQGLPPDKLQRFYPGFTSMDSYNPRKWAGSFGKAIVTSTSPVQHDITRYLLLHDSLMLEASKKEAQTLEAFRATYGSGNKQLMNAWADSVRLNRSPQYKAQAADLFIRRHPHSEAAILAMLDNLHEKTTNYRFNQYFKALPPRLQTSFYGQVLVRELTVPDKPAKHRQHWVGGSITYLKGKTPAGKPLDVLQVFGKNKLTLVSFWASWHAPSRLQMPHFQKLYRQYRDQGFDIIAVSFDQSHQDWTRAIAREGLRFRHVSELKGPKAEEYLRFRIRDMPFNILFDARGKMVAVDLTPEEVARKLQQAL